MGQLAAALARIASFWSRGHTWTSARVRLVDMPNDITGIIIITIEVIWNDLLCVDVLRGHSGTVVS